MAKSGMTKAQRAKIVKQKRNEIDGNFCRMEVGCLAVKKTYVREIIRILDCGEPLAQSTFIEIFMRGFIEFSHGWNGVPVYELKKRFSKYDLQNGTDEQLQ